MRVLFVTPRFPYPPNRGDTLRSWHVLSALARRHEVWLVSVDRDRPSDASLATANALCARVAVLQRSAMRSLAAGLLGFLAGRPLTTGYFADARLGKLIAEWSGETEFDAALVYSSSIAASLGELRARRRVVDLGDVDSVKWETYARRSLSPLRWFYALEGRRVAAVEAMLCRSYDVSVVVNDRERAKLERRVPGLRAQVAPTTIDLSEHAAMADRPLTAEPVIGFVGSMFYPPNERAALWFAKYVWPLVRERVRDARWLIVGARPTRRVRQLGRRPGVEVTGAVPDVRPHLARMRVFVDPVDGDLGVQSKLIVAMAAGRPSVVTPDVAAGIVPSDPPPFMVAASPRGFADAVIRLLRDDAQARALAARARRFTAQHYGAETVAAKWERWLGGDSTALPRTVHPRAMAIGARDLETLVTP